MAGRLKFLLAYFFSWTVFFELSRLAFLLYHFPLSKQLPLTDQLLSFWYGWRMDSSMAAYFLIPVCIAVLASVFFAPFRRPLLYKVYTWLIFFVVLLIVLSDLELYAQWGFRIDATPLRYLSSPREVWASISHLPIVLIAIIFIIVYIGCCLLFGKLINRMAVWLEGRTNPFLSPLAILSFTILLLFPIRGGWQQTPMNQSSVYFSKNNFANVIAVNATWNFVHGLMNHTNASKNPYLYFTEDKAAHIVDSLYSPTTIGAPVLKTTRPNVIVIIWEGFTEKATHLSFEGKEVTPRFNELKKQGIYFSHVYASGDRTDKGLAAVLSGYPAMNNVSVLRLPGKSARLHTLGALFKGQGYHTSFFYGGESEFANIKSYVLQSHYDDLIDKNDFSGKDLNSKWGAHDGVVAARVLHDLDRTKPPFFATWLTLSSHEPFEVPVPSVFSGNSEEILFANSLHYSDESVYKFVQQCSRQAWWNNTLLIITADHGHPLLSPSTRLDNFKIPVLWLGGALAQKGIDMPKYASQLDIASTLAAQLGIRDKLFPFSRNMFDTLGKEWAYFSFNDGFGFVQPGKAFVFDNVGKQVVQQTGSVEAKDLEAGKAMQQVTYADYMKK